MNTFSFHAHSRYFMDSKFEIDVSGEALSSGDEADDKLVTVRSAKAVEVPAAENDVDGRCRCCCCFCWATALSAEVFGCAADGPADAEDEGALRLFSLLMCVKPFKLLASFSSTVMLSGLSMR